MLRNPENESQLHDWCRSLVEDGKELRKGHEGMWWENISVFFGDLWAEYNPHTGKLDETPKPDHKVRMAINLANPVIRTEYAKILKNRPIVDVIAGSTDKKDLNAAEVGDKVLNNYIEKQFHMARVRRAAAMWCLLTGMGAIFMDFNQTSKGWIEIPADLSGDPTSDPVAIEELKAYWKDKRKALKTIKIPQGDHRICALSPFQWIWDFSKMDPMDEDCAWGIVSEVFDVNEVKSRWGVDVEPMKNVKPNILESRLLARLDLTKTLDYSSLVSTELAEIHRLFVKPGHSLFKNGAEVIFNDDEILDVTKFPFEHGQLPVATMGHIPFPVSRYPLSVLTQIKDPVLELSKTESQLVENRNLMANPPWLEYDANGIADDAIQNRPGLRIKVQYRPGVPEPHPIQMPEMPNYVLDIKNTLREHILEISGQGETSQGRVPAGARSGVAIAYLQEEDDTKLGPTIQEYEEMIEVVSWQILKNTAQFYTIPRTIQIFRRNSEPEVIDFTGTLLNGIAGVEVQAGSALPRSKAAKQQFMFDLWDRGVIQDPRQLMEMLELTQGEPLEWEIDMAQAERENLILRLGKPVDVQPWYNHEAHLQVHHREMKSPEYDELDDREKQFYIDHCTMHERFDQQNKLKQAALGMVTGGANGGTPAPNIANGMNNQTVPQGGSFAPGQTPPPLTNETPQ